jgi:sensor domain CHASE-containing protein
MSLYSKVILLLCAALAAFGSVNYLVQREVILPSFESLEEDLARTDMERVVRALDGELEQLQFFSADWGNWLETYRYMAGEHPSFIDDNMTPATVEAARLDAIAYVDRDARFVWRQGYDPATYAPLAYAMLGGDALPAEHPFRAAIAAGQGAKGLVLTEHGPAMMVTAPVLDGAGNGPHRGAVLLARVITPEVAARLAEQAQVRLTVDALQPAMATDPEAERQPGSVVTPHGLSLEVSRRLLDLGGAPVATLRIEVPRSVTARGLDAIGFALLSLLFAGIVVLFVLLVALRIMVLRPVSRMTRHAVAIAEGDDLTQRMNVRRNDELGVLAREFDHMVDQLADTRRRLVDQSFEAGAAQVASGLLHNVGNAMTPLGVTVAGLQRRLREAPAGEVEMAIAELETDAADPARRADLEQLLRLAGRELAQVVARAGDDADAVARHADTIQRILAHQLRATDAGPVVEQVALDTVVARGLEMVAPAMLQRLRLELDGSLAALGALPLPRMLLQQVVQNLALNAAEAARAGGGTLRICARLPEDDGDETLVLHFVDDGNGIEPSHLPRVFEKGFSTKSTGTNLGIGLHWCANALHAVGGGLHADSQGVGRGATLEVRLPVHRRTGKTIARAA